MKKPDAELVKARKECCEFPYRTESVYLATNNPVGELEASYAPFVHLDEEFYFYVSEMSPHTENMISTGAVSMMFIEDEATSVHLFARRRLTYQCSVVEVLRGGINYARVLVAFQERFGTFIDMLRKLQDVHMFRATPENGRYVRGFAQAFTFRGRHLHSLQREIGSNPVPEPELQPSTEITPIVSMSDIDHQKAIALESL